MSLFWGAGGFPGDGEAEDADCPGLGWGVNEG